MTHGDEVPGTYHGDQPGLLDREPILTVGTITNLVLAAIGLAVAFGYDFSEEQKNALVGFIGAAWVAVEMALLLYRRMVYSPATHEREVDEAFDVGFDSAFAGAVDPPAPVGY